MSESNNYVQGLFKGTILEHGYGYAPREIMRDKTISKGAKVIYAYLMSFAGDSFTAFPTVKTVCEELGFGSEETYYKYLNELKSNGLVYTELKKNEKGKFLKNMFYITLQKTEITKLKQEINEKYNLSSENQSTVKPTSENQSSENPSTENRGTNINHSFNINNTLNIEEQETFQEVYKAYFESKGKIISPTEKLKLAELFKIYPLDVLLLAIDVMAEKAEKPSISYLKNTLQDWYSKGLISIELICKSINEYELINKKAKENRRKKIENMANENTTSNKKIDTFNNFEQRTYDFDSLEKKLLGWSD